MEEVVKKVEIRVTKGKENQPQRQEPKPVKEEPVKIERQPTYTQPLMLQPQRSHVLYPIGSGPNDDKASHFENYFDYGDNY